MHGDLSLLRALCLEHQLVRRGSLEQRASSGTLGIYVCCFGATQGGEFSVTASLHFSPGAPRMGEELVWAPLPSAWVLGGMQMRILEGRLCRTKEEWSPGGWLLMREPEGTKRAYARIRSLQELVRFLNVPQKIVPQGVDEYNEK